MYWPAGCNAQVGTFGDGTFKVGPRDDTASELEHHLFKRKAETRDAVIQAFVTEEARRVLVDQLEKRFFTGAEIPSKVCMAAH